MFTLINTCVIVKNSMKHHHLKTREYHDLHVQISTSLLADLLENFQYMCLEISELNPTHFFTSMSGMTSSIKKKTKVKADLSTGMNMLLMIEKDIRVGICHTIH